MRFAAARGTIDERTKDGNFALTAFSSGRI